MKDYKISQNFGKMVCMNKCEKRVKLIKYYYYIMIIISVENELIFLLDNMFL